MAYVRKAKVYVLEWEKGHQLGGLEVRVKSLPMGKLVAMLSAIPTLQTLGVDAPPEMLAQVSEALDAIGEGILSWNMTEEDGSPTPCTIEAFMNLEPFEREGIISAWAQAGAAAPAPLPVPSPSGEEVASLPMVEFQGSPGS